ncbi:amidohydrolase family protein [Kocuria rhizophila]|nr:hypothetical protein [Bacillus sp. BGMRC0062]
MTAPQPRTRVWTNGSVYSPADPFATAILISGPTVAWVGSDDAARAMAGPDVTPGDLRAAVVTPAFVGHHRVPPLERATSGVDDRGEDTGGAAAPGSAGRDGAEVAPGAGDPARPASGGAPDLPAAEGIPDPHALPGSCQGYGAVELVSCDPRALEQAAERVKADGAQPLPVLVRAATSHEDLDPSTLPSASLGFDAAGLEDTDSLRTAAREHLVACTRAGLQAVLLLPLLSEPEESPAETAAGGAASSSGERVDALLDAAAEAQESTGQRTFRARGHRLVGVGDLDDAQCQRLASLGLAVSCHAGAAPLRDLSRAGVPVTLMTDAANPWSAVKTALEAPHERLRTSARAAFLALTRGAWRVQPGATPLAGQLAPGSEATLAVWDAESVMVQQAQGTGSSWSTDPRARTPVLPALDDARLPRCEATVVAGTVVSGDEPRP